MTDHDLTIESYYMHFDGKLTQEEIEDVYQTEFWKPLNWDVEADDQKIQVVRIDRHCHDKFGLMHDRNDLWCYPKGEIPTTFSLKPFNCRIESANVNYYGGALWSIKDESKFKYDSNGLSFYSKFVVYRNNKPFYDEAYTYDEAKDIIKKLREHPISFDNEDWHRNLQGRKILWKSQPGIIVRYIPLQCCVLIRPLSDNKFKKPLEEIEREYEINGSNLKLEELRYEDYEVKDSIFSKNIYWFYNNYTPEEIVEGKVEY